MPSLLSRLSTLRPGKTWIALGAALAIGMIAALSAKGYLSRQMAAMEALGKSATHKMLVAKSALRKGDILSEQTVAVRDVPVDYAHGNAIVPRDFSRIEGRALEYGIKQGDLLLWSLLEGEKVPTFSARVEVGRRAITVHVDEINSISGLLEPGDAIDLVLTLDRQGRKTTFALLQNVKVMATGQRSVPDPRSGERRQYSTVTLDTTQAEAQRVIIAREAGRITALLRNPKDTQVAATDSAALAALLGLAGDMPALADAPATTARAIPVLYGGTSAGFQPDALALRQGLVPTTESPTMASPAMAPPAIAPPAVAPPPDGSTAAAAPTPGPAPAPAPASHPAPAPVAH